MPNSIAKDAVEVLSPAQSYRLICDDLTSTLVDVRTRAEWAYVGGVDLSAASKKPVFLEWQAYPSMQVSSDFVQTLTDRLRAAGATNNTPVLFLCRSGVRSLAAARALAAAGFERCINIADGFEGPLDTAQRRGAASGWKASGLPWVQT